MTPHVPESSREAEWGSAWPSGVGGVQCHECGETTTCRDFGEDPMGLGLGPALWFCRPCVYAEGDDLED